MQVVSSIDGPGCGCDPVDPGASSISIDTALAVISRVTRPVRDTEEVPLAQSRGRILAEDVIARAMVPPFDNAAMDGYAVSLSDFSGDGPWSLTVTGQVAAGEEGAEDLSPGQATRVLTGAPVPIGADAVLMQEEVRKDGDAIHVSTCPKEGENIRRAGEDLTADQTVLFAGQRMTGRSIAVGAAAGQGSVQVCRKLRVGLLSTGNELIDSGEQLTAGKIWDINTPMLAASIPEGFCTVTIKAKAVDDLVSVKHELAEMAATSDLVITTGGVSVGDADFTRLAFSELGGDMLFSGVAMKPGKPVSFGLIGETYWLGLPGNPFAAYVTWDLFGQFVLDCLNGQSSPTARRRHVVLKQAIRHREGRCELRRARLVGFDGMGREIAECVQHPGSARVSDFSQADGVVFLPGDTEEIAAGGLAEFLPFGG